MDLIKELAFILSKNPTKDFDLILPQNSKNRQLFDLIVKEKVKSNDEAARIIYDSDASEKKYIMLKKHLIEKLSGLVLTADYKENKYKSYNQIQFWCDKQLTIVEKLLLQNVYHNPEKILKKLLQTSVNYHLIDIKVRALRKLRAVYCLKGFATETEECDTMLKEAMEEQTCHSEALGYTHILQSKLKFSIARLKEVAQRSEEYAIRIDSWYNKYKNPFLRLYFLQIELIRSKHSLEYKGALNILDETAKLLKDCEYLNSNMMMLSLNYEYAYYYRSVNNLEKASEYMEVCQKMSEYQAFNKFLIQELQFDILIKKGDYEEAVKLLWEVMNTTQYIYLDPLDISAWETRKAYIYYLLLKEGRSDEIIKYLPEFTSNFDFHEFLNRTKLSKKDKHGYRVLLLIIRMFILCEKDLENIHFEGNNLLIYYHRYLKGLTTFRTKAFLKAMSKVSASGFSKSEISKQSLELEKVLESGEKAYEPCEIVPFDKLWSIFLNLAK